MIEVIAASHVRVITRYTDRRIMGKPGASHTLCGAEVSAQDVAAPDARRLSPNEAAKWITCEKCRDAVTMRETIRRAAMKCWECQECGKAMTMAQASRAMSQGCAKCGGTDVELVEGSAR